MPIIASRFLATIAAVVITWPWSLSEVITVVKPELDGFPIQPRETVVAPTGSSPCEVALRNVMNISSLCLGRYLPFESNRYYCQDDQGCRKSLIGPVRRLTMPCRNAVEFHPTISTLFDQIAYATTVACPTSDRSCDVQSELVSAMSDFPASHSLQCTSCVKKSFGRRSLQSNSLDFESTGKVRCNKINGQYCDVIGYPSSADLCQPCYQRAFAKYLSSDVAHNIAEPVDRLLRACYDDGQGASCYENAARILTNAHNVVVDDHGLFQAFGHLDICNTNDACGNPKCRSLLRTLVYEVGCCSPALPLLLMRNLDLPCLEPILHTMVGADAACLPPITYYVYVTVATMRSPAAVCEAVRQDLATTLAMLPDLITCAKYAAPDDRAQAYLTVRATVKRYQSVGMPTTMAFDPDLLQDPVIAVWTSTTL